MAKTYAYVLAAWLCCERLRDTLPTEEVRPESITDEEPLGRAESLAEYLEDKCQVLKCELVSDDDGGDDDGGDDDGGDDDGGDDDGGDDDGGHEIEVSMQIVLHFDESQMESLEDSPTPIDEAVRELEESLRVYLEARYRVDYWDILDDSLTTYLLDVYDEGAVSTDANNDQAGLEVEDDRESERT